MAILYEVNKRSNEKAYEIPDPDAWIMHTISGAFTTAGLEENESLKNSIHKTATEHIASFVRRATHIKRTTGKDMVSIFPEIIKDMEQSIELTTTVYARIDDGQGFKEALIEEGIRDRHNLALAGLIPREIERRIMASIFFATAVYRDQSSSDALTAFLASVGTVKSARQAIFQPRKSGALSRFSHAHGEKNDRLRR